MSKRRKGRRKRGKQKKKVSYKDKSWYSVIAPKSFDNEEIGQIIGSEGNIVGRTLDTLLFDFTNDYDDINLKLNFKITDVNETAKQCSSVFMGHEYTSDYVRSLVGSNASKIQIIKNFTTKDNFKYRLTGVCVTIKKARSSQMRVIRKIMYDILNEFAKSLNHEKFVRGMIKGEFGRQIQRISKTIYPLSSSTIIKSKLVTIPEGGEDQVVPDEEFEVVEVDVPRTRKSEIKRTERINVRKYSRKGRKGKSNEKEKEKEKEESEEKEENEDSSEEE
ncbi:MAG: hypothetical protein ACOC35_08755 [Promethearchaeia archaeon]